MICILAGWTTQARAQPSGVVLEWSEPSECESRAALVAELERLLGRSLSEAPATHVRAMVLARSPELRLELWMEREGGGSSRTLDGPSCEALVRAGALIIAVAIDPEAVAQSEPELEEDPPSEPLEARAAVQVQSAAPIVASVVAPAVEPRREPATDRAPDAHAGIGARFIASVAPALLLGPLPEPAPALGVSLGVGLGPIELTLAALVAPEQEAALTDSDAAGRLGIALGRLRGCASLEPVGPSLELLPCLVVEAGAMWGHGENVPIVRSGTAPWVAGAAGFEARLWIVDAFALGLSAELVVPFVPPRFILTLEGEPQELHRASDVGGHFGLTMTLRIR